MSNRRLQETPSTVEMYVASTDELLQEPGSESGPGLKRSQTMQVPPPRHAPPRKLNLAADGELTSSSESHGEGKLRAAQNELGMVAAELRDTVIELKESQQNLRQVSSSTMSPNTHCHVSSKNSNTCQSSACPV